MVPPPDPRTPESAKDPTLRSVDDILNDRSARLGWPTRILIGLIVLGLLGAAGWFGYQRFGPGAPTSAAIDTPRFGPGGPGGGPGGPGGGPPGGGGGASRPIPVVAAPALTSDIDLFLNGLGTVTPLRTVTVRSRVEGQLLRVHFNEGDNVRAGQLLAEIDPRPFEVQLAQADGQMARDRALLENARIDLKRYQTLFEQDSIARQQVDTQAALVRQYDAAIRVNQGAIDSARLQLTYARIVAPISGRAGLRQVDPGNIVRAGDAAGIVVITQLQPVAVVFSVPQDDLPALMKRVRAKEKLQVEVLDREQKVLLAKGVLASVDNLVDPATGTVKLKAEFANQDASLFPNQFVNARMRLDTLKDATVVPSAALQRGSQGMFVYIVTGDNRVAVRPVKLGPTDGTRVAISEGVAAGEVVVTDGMDRLREGATVEVASDRPVFKPQPGGGKGGKGGGRRKPPAGEGGDGAAGSTDAKATAESAGKVPADGARTGKRPPRE